jgi:hypothetical protein
MNFTRLLTDLHTQPLLQPARREARVVASVHPAADGAWAAPTTTPAASSPWGRRSSTVEGWVHRSRCRCRGERLPPAARPAARPSCARWPRR